MRHVCLSSLSAAFVLSTATLFAQPRTRYPAAAPAQPPAAAPPAAPPPAAPPAQPPAAPPQAQRGTQPDPAWVKELPTVNAVVARYSAATPETRLKQRTAFAILTDYLEVRANVDQRKSGAAIKAQLPRGAAARWSEYVANGYWKMLTASDGSLQLFEDQRFRAEVLSQHVAPASLAAYEAARVRYHGSPQVAASNAESASPGLAPSRVTDAVRQLLRDRMLAQSAGTDLGVFGIKLTHPLELPACPAPKPTLLNPFGDAYMGVVISSPCVGSGGLIAAMSEEGLQASRKHLRAAGVQEVTVLFPKQVCPEWLTQQLSTSCRVNVVLRDGHVASVYFRTNGKSYSQKILDTLQKKYGAPVPASDSADAWCEVLGRETVRFKVRVFRPKAVRVSYNALATQCPSLNDNDGAGAVFVDTDAYTEWLAQAESRNEAQKMDL